MGEFMHDDICEEILVRLDVEDLIRCKSVCKSWKSLITHPLFVKTHHRRQVTYHMAIVPYSYFSKYGLEHYMVGSSNGLACIISFYGNEIIVANPWTREERILQKPRPISRCSCWGFGYDSLTDDYKVVFGAEESLNKTIFYVLSLKSNVWKHVGHVNYGCFGFGDVVEIGTLRNGALHWVMFGNEGLLISFDLSKEVFTEIKQPDDAIHECSFLAIGEYSVGFINEYDCMLFNKQNVKYYWDNMGRSWRLGMECGRDRWYKFIPTTVMPSLISPHLHEGNE